MERLVAFVNSITTVSPQTLWSMAGLFVAGDLKKGEYFVEKGVVATEIAFLETGFVRAYYLNSEGKEYNKTFFAAPSIIGSYASLISKKPNEVAQQALTDCRIWRASFDRIEALSKDNIEIERLRRIIAEGFFLNLEKKELDMALLEAEQRYLALREDYPGIELEVPQYHIAAYLGISPTHLSRIRKKLA